MRGCCAPGLPVDIGPPLRWVFPGAANSSVVWAAPRSLPPSPRVPGQGCARRRGFLAGGAERGGPDGWVRSQLCITSPRPSEPARDWGPPPQSSHPRPQGLRWGPGGGGGGKQVPWGSPATPPRRLPVVICSSLKCNQENSLATPAAVQRGSADWRVPPSFGLRLNLETETELYSNICHYN